MLKASPDKGSQYHFHRAHIPRPFLPMMIAVPVSWYMGKKPLEDIFVF
ncbi:hypothetical protein [Bartonella bilalgolemii]|uniref:Uncharacterized protein n=1 Tax=Bartonella bilalgolemii TaxID=2942911 RepID=A0ABT0PB30_9HYPH|nr:hypothetical protein [Bartonella sp. G70]MCL6230048.1 hypothetical protein [Bartonella sp. G70]